MKKISKILTGSWIIFSLMALFPGIASANGNLTIIVKDPNPYSNNQSWFNYEKNPGDIINDVATVKNLGDKPVQARVYPVDATSNDSGSFILRLENEARNGIGKWTNINTASAFTVPPQGSVDVPFQIKIPDALTPGQYFGGIVLEEANPAPTISQFAASAANGQTICCTNIQIKTRIGLRIYLTIPGTIKDSMLWTGFTTTQKNKTTNFQFEIKNTGNVALEPIATITVYDNMGNQIDRFQKSLGDSLPGTEISPVVSWDKQPLFGSFKAVSELDYRIKSQAVNQPLHGSAQLGSKTSTFNVVPWKILLILLLCVITVGIMYLAYIKNQNQIRKNWVPYQVQPDDNIVNIAKSHSVDWKKLVRVNKLKAPYLIKEGQSIRVPKTPDKKEKTNE